MTKTTTKTINAAIYGRLSVDRSNGDSVSVERQLADCRDLAAKRGWTVVAEHRDDSKSAWKRGVRRPGWEALLADIEEGTVGAVVVWHGDRLMRQPRDLERLIGLVEERGLLIASPSGEKDLGNSDDRAILRIEVAMQCRESDSTSRRVRRVKEEAAGQGRRHGFTPFGWNTPEEGEVVAEIVKRLLAGGSLRSIARDLNSRGVTTLRGGPWSEHQVRGVALRASNAGLRVHLGAVVGEGTWPALVSTDDHERVVRLLTDPKRKTTRTGTIHLLSGVLRCGKCGGAMRHAQVGGRGLYRCERLDTSATAAPIEEFVLELVNRRLNADDASAVTEPSTEAYDALTSKLAALRGKLDDLADYAADGVLDRGQLKRANERVRAQIVDVEAELREHEKRSASLAARGVDVFGLPVEAQRSLLRGLLTVRVNPATRWGAAARSFDFDRLAVAWK